VLAPHVEIGYQYSGQSILGGSLQGKPDSATISGQTIPIFTQPFLTTKDSLPDVFSWAIGTEVALGRRNTVLVDILGNQIGLANKIPSLQSTSVSGILPTTPGNAAGTVMATGFAANGTRISFGQYSGAFGYKARITGNLVVTFQALVRFDSNGLTARVVPLYGLGYSF
jgi:hypothetical protein